MKQISAQTGICFFRATGAVNLRRLLQDADFTPLELTIDAPRVESWLELGCVYVDGRRTRADLALQADQIVRVHTRPKHYFDPNTPLTPHLIENNAEFLVLDKPAGLPTHPTLDNYVENAKTLLERELGQALYTTHRLDVPTQGLLVIAKTPAAQALLNRMFSLGRVRKIYRARLGAPVVPGPYVHYMDPASRVPKAVASEPREGWWTCRMHVLRAEGRDVEIELLTGKTHQIRAQMAAVGAPIVGDVTYGGAPHMHLMLECRQLGFRFRTQDYVCTRPRSISEAFRE